MADRSNHRVQNKLFSNLVNSPCPAFLVMDIFKNKTKSLDRFGSRQSPCRCRLSHLISSGISSRVFCLSLLFTQLCSLSKRFAVVYCHRLQRLSAERRDEFTSNCSSSTANRVSSFISHLFRSARCACAFPFLFLIIS